MVHQAALSYRNSGMKTLGGLLVSTLAVVLLAGCGSGRLSHASLVDKANAICADYHGRVAKLPLPKSVGAYEVYARRTLPLYRRALVQLASLRPPSADEATYRSWLLNGRTIQRDIVRIVVAARARLLPRLQAAVLRARRDDARAGKLARRLGLAACARA
jgi:hypothetical protein